MVDPAAAQAALIVESVPRDKQAAVLSICSEVLGLLVRFSPAPTHTYKELAMATAAFAKLSEGMPNIVRAQGLRAAARYFNILANEIDPEHAPS